jgi:hypothetical protein
VAKHSGELNAAKFNLNRDVSLIDKMFSPRRRGSVIARSATSWMNPKSGKLKRFGLSLMISDPFRLAAGYFSASVVPL